MSNTVNGQVTLAREELYLQVWSTPMSTLARKYGLSDVGLAKVCDRHQIPRPPRGHWAKLEFGKENPRPPLPPCDDPALQRVTLLAPPLPDGDEPPQKPDAAAVAAPAPPEERIRVSQQLVHPHPLVERTLHSLEAARPGEDGLVRPRASRCLAVVVAPSSIERAVRILDALVKALECRATKFR